MQYVCLLLEELESIRLGDLDRLEQEECAQQMCIYRSTFRGILEVARSKLADALINGKAIQREENNFELTQRPVQMWQ